MFGDGSVAGSRDFATTFGLGPAATAFAKADAAEASAGRADELRARPLPKAAPTGLSYELGPAATAFAKAEEASRCAAAADAEADAAEASAARAASWAAAARQSSLDAHVAARACWGGFKGGGGSKG